MSLIFTRTNGTVYLGFYGRANVLVKIDFTVQTRLAGLEPQQSNNLDCTGCSFCFLTTLTPHNFFVLRLRGQLISHDIRA